MIYLTHGVVPRWNSRRISHALFISEPLFEEYVARLSRKYVTLEQALEGNGDALTIDDATYGAFRAALIARKYGHAVSWFVNGLNVESKTAYFPFQLSWMLDETRRTSCVLGAQRWSLMSLDSRRALRLWLKQSYMAMPSCAQTGELVETCADALQADPFRMEKPLCTVTECELAQAASAGVELCNHGWSHCNPRLSSQGQLSASLELNESYLSRFQAEVNKAFAPPFGRNVGFSPRASCTLLADRAFPCGRWDDRVINRSELSLRDAAQTAALPIQPAAAISSSGGQWLAGTTP